MTPRDLNEAHICAKIALGAHKTSTYRVVMDNLASSTSGYSNRKDTPLYETSNGGKGKIEWK